MNMREFVAEGALTFAWPLAARAQQGVKVTSSSSATAGQTCPPPLALFVRGCEETGFAEGDNVAIEYGWAEGRNNRLPALAVEWLAFRCYCAALSPNRAAAAVTVAFCLSMEAANSSGELGRTSCPVAASRLLIAGSLPTF